MAKKTYDDDDGRTIADMSGVERDRLITVRRIKKQGAPDEQSEMQSESEIPAEEYTKEQRHAAVGGALAAAMLIGGIFIAAGALVIWLITLLGR